MKYLTCKLKNMTLISVLVGILIVLALNLNEYDRILAAKIKLGDMAKGFKFIQNKLLLYLLFLFPLIALMLRCNCRKEEYTTHPVAGYKKHLLILASFMFCLMFTGFIHHPWFYFLDWIPANGNLFDSGIVLFILLTALLTPFLITRKKHIWIAIMILLFIVQYKSYYLLIKMTGGAPLCRDDHPSFIFRLWEFAATFPQLKNYNPYWNAGTTDYVGVTSGITGIGMFFLPLMKFFSVTAIYTYMIGSVYIILLPLLAVFSVRSIGAGKTAMFTAGILSLGIGWQYFLWLLHYGTLGAILSSMLIMPAAVLSYRIVWLDKKDKCTIALLILCVYFLVQWPLGALMGAGLVLSMLFSAKKWTLRKLIILACCALFVGIMVSRNIAVVVNDDKSIISHVMEQKTEPEKMPVQFVSNMISNGYSRLVSNLDQSHPVILFLGLGGIFFISARSVRNWFGPLILWLGLITAFGPEFKPKMQLDRMIIPMLAVAVVPASIAVDKLLATSGKWSAFVRGGVLAIIILGGFNASKVYGNNGRTSYVVLNCEMKNLISWIKDNVPKDSRIVFAGRTVHGYGGGHVAYLPIYTGREMMACDYYHFPVGTIEYDYPPRANRINDENMERFISNYNASCFITYHDNYRDYFTERTNLYEKAIESGSAPKITVFRVKKNGTLFIAGQGSIEAGFNFIKINLDSIDERVIIKYNWIENLEPNKGVETFPYDAGDGTKLIGIKPNGNRQIILKY